MKTFLQMKKIDIATLERAFKKEELGFQMKRAKADKGATKKRVKV
jgi:hypothetical protein